MDLLSQAELIAMRREYDSSLPDVCEVRLRQQTTDESGATVDTWPETNVAIACRIQSLEDGAERAAAMGIQATQMWEVLLPYNVAAPPTARIVLPDGSVFDVLAERRLDTWTPGNVVLVVRVQ